MREVREELGCDVELVGRIHEVVFHAYEAFDLYMLRLRELRDRAPADAAPRSRWRRWPGFRPPELPAPGCDLFCAARTIRSRARLRLGPRLHAR